MLQHAEKLNNPALENYETKKKILAFLAMSPKSKDEIKKEIDLDPDICKQLLRELMDIGNLIYDKNTKRYESILNSFYDLVKNDDELDIIDKVIIVRRISNESLKKVADEVGISSETVRLKEKKIINYIFHKYSLNDYTFHNNYLILKDDYYEHPLLKASLSKELFYYGRIHHKSDLLSANYYYDKIRTMNKLNAIDLFASIQEDFSLIAPDVLDDIISVYNPCITDDGFISNQFDAKVIAHLLKLYGPTKAEEISLWHKESIHLINTPNKKEKSIAYYRDTILENKNIIRTEKALRYYDFEKYKKRIDILIPELQEICYEYSGKINSYYILKKMRKELEKIDIHNKYELHSLIKKIGLENITALRTPYLQINNASKR